LYHNYSRVCLCFRYESKGKQFAKNQPQYPVGLSPEIINAAKAKKEKADRAASKSNPIPGLVIVSTLEGIEMYCFCLALGRVLLLYINFGKDILQAQCSQPVILTFNMQAVLYKVIVIL